MPTTTSDGDPARPSSHATALSSPASVFLNGIGGHISAPRSSTAPMTWSVLAMSTPA